MEPDVKKALADLENLKAWAEGGDRVEAADIEAVINILNPPKPPLPEEQDHDHKGHWKAEDTEIYVWVDDIAYPAQDSMDAKVIKTPQSRQFEGDIYRSKDMCICQLQISTPETQGDKHPPGVHGYTPQKSNCPEYVEGPQPTWVTSLKVPKNPNYGNKPLKTFAGRDLR